MLESKPAWSIGDATATVSHHTERTPSFLNAFGPCSAPGFIWPNHMGAPITLTIRGSITPDADFQRASCQRDNERRICHTIYPVISTTSPGMRLIIKDDAAQVADWVASYVAARINDFAPSASKPFVLGLPTGSSPLQTYKKV